VKLKRLRLQLLFQVSEGVKPMQVRDADVVVVVVLVVVVDSGAVVVVGVDVLRQCCVMQAFVAVDCRCCWLLLLLPFDAVAAAGCCRWLPLLLFDTVAAAGWWL